MMDIPAGWRLGTFEESLIGFGPLREHFAPIRNDTGWVDANEKTIIGLLAKSAPNYKMKLSPQIAINEPGPLHRQPVSRVLRDLASLADSIIKLFDAP